MSRARLAVVGAGIQASAHISALARSHVEEADKVVYLTADSASSAWVRRANPSAESLERFYARGKPREATYEETVDYVLSFVRVGLRTCFVVYGHPGVFAYATHESVRRARAEGYEATMLPAISAEDCLFADLGIDPADNGCQSYEATDFLIHDRIVDPTSALILWQVGATGNLELVESCDERALAVLIESLERVYGAGHRVALYRASAHPIVRPRITWLTVRELATAEIVPMDTLYIPPAHEPRVNLEIVRRLGLTKALGYEVA
jgi:precorrin-6B methylase 1